jgi:hypothetical protein
MSFAWHAEIRPSNLRKMCVEYLAPCGEYAV